MNKELYVSTTPHETKVGITEDDQLAEIYLERENEYTLAGSIYKGRVTRVLPGMQSAFVDIGLERDAFLYVSDFMDLEQQDEDLDEAIPANRPVMEARPRPGLEAGGAAMNGEEHLPEAGSAAGEEREAAASEARATPRAHRATFADDGVVADVGERSGADRAEIEATVQNAAKFEANLVAKTAAKSARKPVAKSATSLTTKFGVNPETTASAAATVQDAAVRTRDSSDPRRRPLAPVATTITGRHRDINRWCFPANRSRSTSGKRRVRD